MTSLVLDTHSLIWYLHQSSRLSATAQSAIRSAIESGYKVYLSSVSIVEITYLVEKERLLSKQLEDLLTLLHKPDSGLAVQPFDLAIAEILAKIPRDQVPDMPDRMIAATALFLQVPLVTVDSQIQAADVPTLW